MEFPEVMRRSDAAKYLGISIASFDKVRKDIKTIRIGKSVRFRKADIEEYLAKNAAYPN